MKALYGPGKQLEAGCAQQGQLKSILAERIEGLDEEMDAALAKGEYERVVKLADELERLLEALMI